VSSRRSSKRTSTRKRDGQLCIHLHLRRHAGIVSVADYISFIRAFSLFFFISISLSLSLPLSLSLSLSLSLFPFSSLSVSFFLSLSLSRTVQTILNEVLQSQFEDYLPYLGGAAGALVVTGVAYWASRPTAERPLFPLDAQALLLPVRETNMCTSRVRISYHASRNSKNPLTRLSRGDGAISGKRALHVTWSSGQVKRKLSSFNRSALSCCPVLSFPLRDNVWIPVSSARCNAICSSQNEEKQSLVSTYCVKCGNA